MREWLAGHSRGGGAMRKMNDKEKEEYRRGFEKAREDSRKRLSIFLWIQVGISAAAILISIIAVADIHL